MKYFFAILVAITTFLISNGQSKLKTKAPADTLLNKILKDLPHGMQDEFLKEYKKMSPEQKKTMLQFSEFVSSVPKSSKKQLIQNIDTNYNNVLALKNFFRKIVPANYSIYIEFKPPEKMLKLDESIDFWVFKKISDSTQDETIFQEWNVELRSAKLDSLLALTPLNRSNLQELRNYLDKANCISISNRDICEIGYARSGMGKYSYLIFDNALSDEEKKQYSNDCEYIFYKNNIVLEYGGGAIGAQCFPD